jgi:hypothetical protein
MIAVRAINDGKRVKFLENIPVTQPTKIIVTFLEDEPLPGDSEISGPEIRYLAEKGGSFDFLNDSEEDIYSDDDLVGIISEKDDGSINHMISIFILKRIYERTRNNEISWF